MGFALNAVLQTANYTSDIHKISTMQRPQKNKPHILLSYLLYYCQNCIQHASSASQDAEVSRSKYTVSVTCVVTSSGVLHCFMQNCFHSSEKLQTIFLLDKPADSKFSQLLLTRIVIISPSII